MSTDPDSSLATSAPSQAPAPAPVKDEPIAPEPYAPVPPGEVVTHLVEIVSVSAVNKTKMDRTPVLVLSLKGGISGRVIGVGRDYATPSATPDGDPTPDPKFSVGAKFKMTLHGFQLKPGLTQTRIESVEPEVVVAPAPAPAPAPAAPAPVPQPAPVTTPTPQPRPMTNSKLKAKSPELVKPGKTKAVLFGVSGVGKTTLALSYPCPYYFDVEGGAKGPQYRELLKKSGGSYMGPEDGTLSFDTLIEQMQALATEKHPYKTLIVDSLTKLFQTTIAQEAERLGSKDAFGASKKPAVAAMRRLVMWTSRLDMNCWFICHETSEWGMIDGQRAEIGRVPDCWEKLVYELDLSIRAVKRGPSRLALVTKSRLTNFPDGETFPLDYAEFAARAGKEVVEGSSEIIVLALPEQIAEIKKLLEIVKVDESAIQKDFDKLGISDYPEMTKDQIETRINSLKKKLSA